MRIEKEVYGLIPDVKDETKRRDLMYSTSGNYTLVPSFDITDFNKPGSSVVPLYTTLYNNTDDLDEGTMDKSFLEVVKGKNHLICTIHSPYGISRRILKKPPSYRGSIDDYANEVLYNNHFNVQSITYDDFNLNKKLHPKALEYSEELIRDRCRAYFNSVRPGINFNDNGGNVIYDDTNILREANEKIDPNHMWNTLLPVAQHACTIHGELKVNGLHMVHTQFIFSRHKYANVGLYTLTSGGWRENIRIDDNGGRRILYLGNHQSHVVFEGNTHPEFASNSVHSKLLIAQSLFWNVVWGGHWRPGTNSHHYGIDKECYVVTDMDDGSDSDYKGENYAIHKFIRGHGGHSVGVDYAGDAEVAVLYDGGNRFSYGGDQGSDMLLKAALIR